MNHSLPPATAVETRANDNLTPYWKTTWLLLPLFALTAPVYWAMARLEETPVAAGTWVLVVVSALANVVVIAYHYTIPAHPKFLMVPWRRWILRVHIISGSVELIAGLIACFTRNPTAAIVAGTAALFFHVPSAFFQTRIVFGSKAIMVPAYLLCIITHGFCAAMLLANPTSQMWAVNTFLVFNIYVWCRVYYYLFDLMKLFSSMKYSIAILAAGATMVPALFGSLGFLLLVTFIGAYIVLYRLIFIRDPAAYQDFVRERARDRIMDGNPSVLWTKRRRPREVDDADARAWFSSLDSDQRGQLTPEALHKAIAPWRLPALSSEQFAQRILASGPITYERFKSELWSIGAIQQHARQTLSIERAVSDRDKAELVFRRLDIDADDCLGPAELDLLLIEWGLPATETRRYLARADVDANGKINFSEFLLKMEPIWRYIYHEIFRSHYNRRGNEMVSRGLSAVLDARKRDALREQVKQSLLTRVPFLSGASDELIGNLTASLVVERFGANDLVCREGDPGDKFYLVASGLLRVSKLDEALSDLGPGGCIGEGALLTDSPRNATVTAVQDSTLFSLTRAAFTYLTENHPSIRSQLADLHTTRNVENTAHTLRHEFTRNVPFLRQLRNPQLITDLAEAMDNEFYPAGETILREGEVGGNFYLIESGSVRILRGEIACATLGPAGCFGEGSLLTRTPHNATAIATEDTRLFRLESGAFESILARYPSVRADLSHLHRTRNSTPATP
jgi:CRP-like cAMP-binding protein/Ca2+-binding EF-hand superfamily protein